ncbi:IPExxxVDY family protein [Nonlabens ponticola]|uniref:IPExxxVDY family protein n=1 Tax=Nonlabens ponticola TaxID=2496866 RepID=A0A3S9MVY3_9FLAO|nr:IPExxxVDY family protein [Nonlabens ponticola]AZQ43371.1 IPExxxVDY family protein [Nonlabens ponticola]
MTTYKLADWTIEEDEFILIGIHSTIESYRMAYMINRYLTMNFSREERDQDVNFKDYIASFPVYKFQDQEHHVDHYLVPNMTRASVKAIVSTGSLFDNEQTTEVKTTLIREYRNVDYLLKIEKDPEEYPVKNILNRLIEIPQVISVYQLDTMSIKNADHLIFE